MRRSWAVYVLLLLPYVAALCVPLYNRGAPELAGIPFFYWYQLLWIPFGSLSLLLAYWLETRASGKGRP